MKNDPFALWAPTAEQVELLLVDPADLVLDESSSRVAEQDKVAARNLAVLAEWAGRPSTGAAHRVHERVTQAALEIVDDAAHDEARRLLGALGEHAAQ